MDFDYLKSHPNFSEKKDKEDTFIYYFSENCVLYEICINKKLVNGPTWDIYKDGEVDYEGDIWSTPLWYRQILFEATERFFKKQRMRYLVTKQVRPLWSIVFSSTLLIENGRELYFSTAENKVTENFEVKEGKETLGEKLFFSMKKIDSSLFLYKAKNSNCLQISRKTKQEFESEYWMQKNTP